MRILEICLVLLNIIGTVLFIKGSFYKKSFLAYFPVATLGIFILHILLEKVRWQFVPIYIVTLFYFIWVIWKGPSKKRPISKIRKASIGRKILATLMGLLILASCLANAVFPLYKIPVPTGDYAIGTVSIDVTDPVRKAVYSENSNDQRKIKIQLWYPAQTTKGYKQSPWLEDGKVIARALAKDMKLPTFVLDHTALIMSNSFEKAPISTALEKFPVVVISHGWTGFRNIHTDLAENLASNGYVVVSIDHTYGSDVTVFDNGELAYVNYAALPKRETTPNFLEYANKLVSTYSGDVTLTLDTLEQINKGNQTIDSQSGKTQAIYALAGKMDLANIGLLGHSTGGGGDVMTALSDTRVKALVGLDAWVESLSLAEITQGLRIPTLFMRSGQWADGYNNEHLLALIKNSQGNASLYQTEGTTHLDFTMIYMYSPLTKYFGYSGRLAARYPNVIQRELILSFVNQNLKGDATVNLEVVSEKWPEVTSVH